MLCHILGLKEGEMGNNGTLGFGTQGGGFTVMEKEAIEDAGDLPAEATKTFLPLPQPAASTAAGKKIYSQISEAKLQVDEPTQAPVPNRPVVNKPAEESKNKTATDDKEGKEGEEENLNLKNWFNYVKWKAQRIKEVVVDAWKDAFGSKEKDKDKPDVHM